MQDESTPSSERARKRAVGKIRRDALIKRREADFDLLVSGSSIEQTAGHTKKTPSGVRRAIGQALAKGQLDAPEDYALQVARLTKALRCADVRWERRPEGDCAVREGCEGAEPLPRRQYWPGAAGSAGGAAGNRADIPAACAHSFTERGGHRIVRGEKSCAKDQLSP